MAKGKWDYDVAIVGGGPGGLVSALYLRRFLRSVALLNSGEPRASWIPRTYNLLGFRGGISGAGLLGRLEDQVDELGAIRIAGRFQIRQRDSKGFVLESESRTITARKVIVATGVQDVQPPIDNLLRLRQEGLLRYCPICDAFEYKGKNIAVLAQDEHGLRASLFLAPYGGCLDVIWPGSQKVPAELRKACRDNNVRIHAGELISITEKDHKRGGLWIHVRKNDGRTVRLDSYVCYVALGVVVNDFALRHIAGIERTSEGYLVTDTHQSLGVPGLYAVGDCVQGLAQIATAAGQAAVAATRIHNELRTE